MPLARTFLQGHCGYRISLLYLRSISGIGASIVYCKESSKHEGENHQASLMQIGRQRRSSRITEQLEVLEIRSIGCQDLASLAGSLQYGTSAKSGIMSGDNLGSVHVPP